MSVKSVLTPILFFAALADEIAAMEDPPVVLDVNDLSVFSVDFSGNRELDHPGEEYLTV